MPIASLPTSRLHYQLSGLRTGPVIALVNSLGADLRMWDEVVPHLEKRFQVLRYDARGHGMSDAPRIPYSIEQLGTDLLELLKVISIESVHLCGLSLGGLVALWLGIHAPHKVHKLVLANTSARIGTKDGWEARIATVQSAGMTVLAHGILDRWFTESYRRNHPNEMTRMREMIQRTSSDGYIGCCGVLRDTDLRDKLRVIEAPCLVITGIHDKATPPEDGRALHSGLRNSTYRELESSHLSEIGRAHV